MDCSNHSTHRHLIESLSSPETPLLISSRSLKLTFREKLAQANCLPRRLCLPSKAAVLTLFWTVVVSAIYTTVQKDTVTIVIRLREIEHPAIQKFDLLIMYLVYVVISLLYPLAGFLADIRYGRYRTVIASLCLLLCGFALIGLKIILQLFHVVKNPFSISQKKKNPALFFALTGPGLLFIIVGLSGFQANYIQLGLDQLLDAHSDYIPWPIYTLAWMDDGSWIFTNNTSVSCTQKL